MSDYLMIYLKAPSAEVYLVYSITSVTAPTSGVILGGYWTDRIGGYSKK